MIALTRQIISEDTADVKSGKWKTEEEEVAEKLEMERIKGLKEGHGLGGKGW